MSINVAEITAKPDLLKLIPAGARLIVQIGCRSDALAKAYRRINPRVRYLAVASPTLTPVSAASSDAIDQWVVKDPEIIQPSDLGLDATNPGVDCLIFDEALETMINPALALVRLGGWLRNGGQVLACVANVQHYSVIVDLLRGQWNERERGPINHSHLRFFTLDAIRKRFTEAGLHVFDIRPRWWRGDEFDRFLRVIEPILHPLAIDAASFVSQTRALHYIVCATRSTNPPQRTLIWAHLGSVIGSEVRIAEPFQFLSTIPGVRTLATTNVAIEHLDRVFPGERKILVQQRIVISKSNHIKLQQALIARGFLIVAEFDDDPDHFPTLIADDYFALRSCHAIQTTTPAMADTLRAFNPHVAIFPNQIAVLPAPRVERLKSGDSPPHAVTLFFGALNRESDWPAVIPALNRLLQIHAEAIRVQVVHDRAFFDTLETPNKHFEPLCSHERYHQLLDSADIVLAPLEPLRFSKHKSDLKFIEAAAHGATVLASPTVYEKTIEHGHTGLIYHSIDEFSTHLDRLIKDRVYRTQLGSNARQYVTENRLLTQHFHSRYDWYESLFNQWNELNSELRSRMPELFDAASPPF